MKSLASIFPRASKSFHDANPQTLPAKSIKRNRGASSVIRDAKLIDLVNLGKQVKSGMNSTEAEFALMLEAQKRNGEILRYEFQGITLRWGVDEKTGDSMRYTPDFVVTEKIKTYASEHPKIRLMEVKGPHIHYRQQAVARFKGCRACWPEFQFEMHQKTKQGWKQIL